MVRCPICPNPLRTKMPHLVSCIRGHKFKVEWGDETDRKLVLAVEPKEDVDHHVGDEFPIPDDKEFE